MQQPGSRNCVWEREKEQVGTDVPESSYQHYKSVVRMHPLDHGIPIFFYIYALVVKLDKRKTSSGSMCDSLHV